MEFREIIFWSITSFFYPKIKWRHSQRDRKTKGIFINIQHIFIHDTKLHRNHSQLHSCHMHPMSWLSIICSLCVHFYLPQRTNGISQQYQWQEQHQWYWNTFLNHMNCFPDFLLFSFFLFHSFSRVLSNIIRFIVFSLVLPEEILNYIYFSLFVFDRICGLRTVLYACVKHCGAFHKNIQTMVENSSSGQEKLFTFIA